MVTILRVEDILDGAANIRPWKTMILFILEENEIQDYVKKDVSKQEDVDGKSRHKKE